MTYPSLVTDVVGDTVRVPERVKDGEADADCITVDTWIDDDGVPVREIDTDADGVTLIDPVTDGDAELCTIVNIDMGSNINPLES